MTVQGWPRPCKWCLYSNSNKGEKMKFVLCAAILAISVSSYAAKPDGVGANGADHKAANETERLCKQSVVDQLQALDKKQGAQDNSVAIKALLDQLKACSS